MGRRGDGFPRLPEAKVSEKEGGVGPGVSMGLVVVPLRTPGLDRVPVPPSSVGREGDREGILEGDALFQDLFSFRVAFLPALPFSIPPGTDHCWGWP